MATDWHFLIRDAERRIIGEIDDEQELEVPIRHLDTGAWRIVVDASSRSAELLQEGAGALFVVADEIKLSGPIRPQETQFDQDDGGRGLLTVHGVSDSATVKRAIWPVHDSAISSTGSTQSSAHAVLSGAAETVIRTIIDRHAGPGAAFGRSQPGLVLGADLERGEPVTSQLRMDDLHTATYGIAEVAGLGWDIIQDGHDLLLVFYEPVDRAATARFGIELGNVSAYTYQLTPPELTDLIVGIGGEGNSRVFYRFTDGRDELWPDVIIEEFADRRDIDPDADPMSEDYVDPDVAARQTADERFEETRGTASVAFEPIDTDFLVAGRDFDRGDVVTFETDLGPVVEVIREMRYVRTAAEGQVIIPSIGEEQERPAIYKRVAQIQRRVSELETRR